MRVGTSHGRFDVQDDCLFKLPVHTNQLNLTQVFGSKRCDCKEQLDQSLRYVQEKGGGAVIYLAQEGRGIGLANKVAAYNLQVCDWCLDLALKAFALDTRHAYRRETT